MKTSALRKAAKRRANGNGNGNGNGKKKNPKKTESEIHAAKKKDRIYKAYNITDKTSDTKRKAIDKAYNLKGNK